MQPHCLQLRRSVKFEQVLQDVGGVGDGGLGLGGGGLPPLSPQDPVFLLPLHSQRPPVLLHKFRTAMAEQTWVGCGVGGTVGTAVGLGVGAPVGTGFVGAFVGGGVGAFVGGGVVG